ncbi:hypothetical protein BS47DRAFT_1346598, partial [Hydnum rufescens UP504]
MEGVVEANGVVLRAIVYVAGFPYLVTLSFLSDPPRFSDCSGSTSPEAHTQSWLTAENV